MAAIFVDSINFPVMGKDTNIWKEEIENGSRTILCRNLPKDGSNLIHQFLVLSTDDDPTILTNAEIELNGLGWK